MEPARIPGMNREAYRRIDSRMRRLVGRRNATCSSCPDDSEHVLDRLSLGGDDGIDKYVSITAAVGFAVSIPELTKIKKGTGLPAVLRRVSMLAALYARAILATCDTEAARYKKLCEVTSFKTADDVRKLAARIKGDELTRYELALVLSFFQGALGDMIGVDHGSVVGYRNALQTFDRTFTNLQRRAAGLPVDGPAPKLNALAGLGNLGALGGVFEAALDTVISGLSSLGKQASNLLCRAMEAVFTGSLQPVGGVICAIIRFTLGGFFDTLASGAAIVKVLFAGLAEFFSKLFEGKFTDAALALATSINQVIVIVLGGSFSSFIGIPIVDAQLTEQQKKDGIKSLEAIGRDLPPTFTISLVAGVIGVITSLGSPSAVSALVVAFTPAVTEILGPVLKNGPIEKFRAMTLDKIKLGIEVVIKIGAMVVAGIMSLADVIRKFANAVKSFANRMTTSAEARQKFLAKFMQEFPKAWAKFMEKLKAVQLLNAIEAGKALFLFLPVLLDALAAADPDLFDAVEAGEQIVRSAGPIIDQARETWDQAFNQATPAERIKIAWDQTRETQRKLELLCSQYETDSLCIDYKKNLRPVNPEALTAPPPPRTNKAGRPVGGASRPPAPPASTAKKSKKGLFAAMAGAAVLVAVVITRRA